MTFISRATHTLQWSVQWVAKPRGGANPESRPQFRLQSATRLHEAGVASNRRSAILRWIRSRVLYTPPVTSWKLATPEAGILTLTGRSCLRRGRWLGRSRNKVGVPEGAPGSPPFYGEHTDMPTGVDVTPEQRCLSSGEEACIERR